MKNNNLNPKYAFENFIVGNYTINVHMEKMGEEKHKVKEKNINIDSEILQEIAKRDNLSIRRLEGIINQLVTLSSLEYTLNTKEKDFYSREEP